MRRDRWPGRLAGVVVGVSTLVLALAVAAPSSAWQTELPSGASVPPDGMTVADGHVWWLEVAGTAAHRADRPQVGLASRGLGGGPTRRWSVPFGPYTSAAETFQTRGLDVRAGRAYVTGATCVTDPERRTCPGMGTTVVVDARSGEVVGSRDPGLQFQHGTGLLRDPEAERAGRAMALREPEDGRPIVTVPRNTLRTDARHAVVRTGTSRLNDAGWSRLRVVDLRSGRTRYRISAAAIKRAAFPDVRDRLIDPGGEEFSPWRVAVEGVLPNGSLWLSVGRFRGRGIRPVWVDARGRIRSLRSRLKRADSTESVAARGRVLVRASSRSRRACDRVWVGDLRGLRGRRVAVPDATPASPARWDGRRIVWTPATRTGPSRPEVVSVTNGLDRARLTHAKRPRC